MKASRKNKHLKKQSKTRPISSIPWLAMGTLVAYTAAGGDSALMARAQTAERTLLFDLDLAIQRISGETPNHPSAVQLTGIYHNLLRRWADA